MPHSTSILCRLVEKIADFARDCSSSKKAPDQKFVAEMVYGTLRQQRLTLLKIGLAIDPVLSSHKAVERLGRHLKDFDTDAFWGLLRKRADRLLPETGRVYAVDDSDVAKMYGKSFEAMGAIRDASWPTKRLVNGYHLTSVVALSVHERQPVPIFERLHSSKEKDYRSANEIPFNALNSILPSAPADSVFIFDRGYDDSKLMTMMKGWSIHFLVRATTKRVMKHKGRRVKVFDHAGRYKGKVSLKIRVRGMELEGKASRFVARLAGVPFPVTAILVWTDADKEEPLKIFYTDIKIESKEDLTRTVLLYSERGR